jgi:hypothetical protein
MEDANCRQRPVPAGKSADAPRALSISNQTGFGLKIQLDLVIGSGRERPGSGTRTLRAVVLELMYRARPKFAPGTYVQPPDWLLDGVLASTASRDPSTLVEILYGVATTKKVTPLNNFFSSDRIFSTRLPGNFSALTHSHSSRF